VKNELGEDVKENGHYLMFWVRWRRGSDENHENFIGSTGRDL